MEEVIDFLYSLRNYYIYLTFIIGIPSFLLYLSEVVLIIKHKQLHNSFNILFVVRAIANFLKMWGSIFGYRLPKIVGGLILPFYQILPGRILALYSFLLFFCFYADNFSTAAIQLNRFIAIAFPLHYEKIWLYLLPLSVLIIYGLPFYLSFCFFSVDTKLFIVSNDPLNANGTSFAIIGSFTSCHKDNMNLVTSLSISFLIGCTVLSLLTIFLYLWRKRNPTLNNHRTRYANANNNNNSNASDRIERNLLIYAMCTFAGLGIITIFFNVFDLNLGKNYPLLILALGPILHDICNIVLPSWLMLWASSTFRHKWATDVLPKRWNLFKNETKTKTVNIMCRLLPTQTNNGNPYTIPIPIQKRLFSINQFTAT